MKFSSGILFATLIFAGMSASAAMIFEPSVGYSLSQVKSVNIAKAEEKSEITAPIAGLRLGYISNTRFWLGVDGLAVLSGKLKVKDPAPAVSKEYDTTGASAFASLGYETRSRLRLWAGYGFYDTLTLKDFGLTGDKIFSGGTSWKAGIGFHIVQYLALNFEYVSHSYKRYKGPGTSEGDLAAGGLESFKADATTVSLSMPFFW